MPLLDAGRCTPPWQIAKLRQAESRRNKDGARRLSWRTAILSPSPRAWPFKVGRSRYADRLRPDFLSALGTNKIARKRTVQIPRGTLALHVTASSDESRNYSVAWRSLGLRSRCRAFRPKKSA